MQEAIQPILYTGKKSLLTTKNVEDVDVSVAKARELGATIHMDRVDLPMGSFAVLADPQGATSAFWQGSQEADCE